MERGNTQAFKEKAQSNNGNFLNAKDFLTARKIRPVKWLFEGKLIDIKIYLEGWVEVKGKPNGMPIRFEVDDEIPEGHKWKKSSYQGGPERSQTPKPSVAWLCYDFKTQSLKLASFSQSTVVQQVQGFLDETNEEGENPLYVEDFSKTNIIIAKSGEKSYTVQTKDGPEPEDLEDLLDGFHFSWESFMGCGECFDEEGETSYNDVKELLENSPKKKTVVKKEVKKEVKKDNSWETVKSPAGIMLKDMKDEKLLKLYSALKDEDEDDRDDALWPAVEQALAARGLGLDIPF